MRSYIYLKCTEKTCYYENMQTPYDSHLPGKFDTMHKATQSIGNIQSCLQWTHAARKLIYIPMLLLDVILSFFHTHIFPTYYNNLKKILNGMTTKQRLQLDIPNSNNLKIT